MKKTVEHKFSIYTQYLVDEARSRGISVKGFGKKYESYAILEYKKHREFIKRAGTNKTGYVSGDIFNDKYLTAQILQDLALPSPVCLLTDSKKELTAFLHKHKQIVIKPTDSYGGKGVTVNITKPSQFKKAIEKSLSCSRRYKKTVLAQKQLKGEDHRILVVNKKFVFAVKRVPAHLLGDGKSSINDLLLSWNKIVPVANRKIKMTDESKALLKKQGMKLTDIPTRGQRIALGMLSNSHRGGISIDITDSLCKEVKQMAKKIAKYFDADIIGVDFFSTDISRRPGFITELESDPGLTIHHEPTIGKSRDVASKIIDMLFPETV